MPRIAPGFHIDDLPGSVSILVYDHPAAEVAQAMPGWYRFEDRVQAFTEVLVEWAPPPEADASATRPQSALLCSRLIEPDDGAPYIGSFDCVFFTYQSSSDMGLVRVHRGGQPTHELYWGPDRTSAFLEAGLQPPPLDPGEIALTAGGDSTGADQVRYKGDLRELVCRMATEVGSSRDLVDRVCRELGVAVPDPVYFPDVDYEPQPGDDRDPQIPEDVVDCWLR